MNNVDVTDRTREFPAEEWKLLPKAFRQLLNKMPERQEMNRRFNRNSSATSTTQFTTPSTTADNASTTTVRLDDHAHTQLVNATARAVLAANRARTDGSPANVQMPRMGNGTPRQNRQASSASVVSEVSQPRWDRDGNLL